MVQFLSLLQGLEALLAVILGIGIVILGWDLGSRLVTGLWLIPIGESSGSGSEEQRWLDEMFPDDEWADRRSGFKDEFLEYREHYGFEEARRLYLERHGPR